MVIYVDVLLIVNFLVDYFLIQTVEFITKSKTKVYRCIIGAFIGSLSSLYIFWGIDSVVFDLLLKIIFCCVCTIVVFGFKNIKSFLKYVTTIFIVTALYGGIMKAVLNIFKPKGLYIKNSVVYLNISPLLLIGFTVVFYFVFLGFSLIFKSSSIKSERCDIELYANNNKTKFTAIIDSGNSINDVFGKSDIIIVDKSVYTALFGFGNMDNNPELLKRYRAVPCGTVGGNEILDGYRCDKAKITSSNNVLELDRPILAISKL